MSDDAERQGETGGDGSPVKFVPLMGNAVRWVVAVPGIVLSSVLFKDLPFGLPPAVQVPLIAALCAVAIILLFTREASPIRRLRGMPVAILGAVLLSLILPIALVLGRLSNELLGASIVGAAATAICVTAMVAAYGTHWSWAMVGAGLLLTGSCFVYPLVTGHVEFPVATMVWAGLFLVAGVALLIRRSRSGWSELVPTSSNQTSARILTGLAWALPGVVYTPVGLFLLVGPLLLRSLEWTIIPWGVAVACVGLACVFNAVAAARMSTRLRAIAYVVLGAGIEGIVIMSVLLVVTAGATPAFAEAIGVAGALIPAGASIGVGFTAAGVLYLRGRRTYEQNGPSRLSRWLRYWVTPRPTPDDRPQ